MSTVDDSKLDVETQRRIEYTRQKLLKIEQLSDQLKNIKKGNITNQEKLGRLTRRRDSLEKDMERLTDLSVNIEAETCSDLLDLAGKEPMDLDVVCANEFRNKMSQLNVLLGEIVVRTCFNEKAMCTEIGHQESEFETKLIEAIEARKAVVLKNLEIQSQHQKLTKEHADVYEMCQNLQLQLEQFEASCWLLNAESKRVSDILDKTKRDPKFGREKMQINPAWAATSAEEIISSVPSLSHECYGPEKVPEKLNNDELKLLKTKKPKKNNSELEIQSKPILSDDEGLKSHRSSHRGSIGTWNIADAELDSDHLLEDEIPDIPPEKPNMKPIAYSDSLVSTSNTLSSQGVVQRKSSHKKKVCPIHGNMKKAKKVNERKLESLNMEGVDLMKIIAKCIEEEFS